MNTTKILCKYFDSETKGYVVLGDVLVPCSLVIFFSYFFGGALHAMCFQPEVHHWNLLNTLLYCLNPHHAIPGTLMLIGGIILLAIVIPILYQIGKIALAGLRYIHNVLYSLYNIHIAECPHQKKSNSINAISTETEEIESSTSEFDTKMYSTPIEETE